MQSRTALPPVDWPEPRGARPYTFSLSPDSAAGRDSASATPRARSGRRRNVYSLIDLRESLDRNQRCLEFRPSLDNHNDGQCALDRAPCSKAPMPKADADRS
jgi:hypothetical protein